MTKTTKCRTHGGGVFKYTAKRGRPPVKCDAANSHGPCTRAGGEISVSDPKPLTQRELREQRKETPVAKQERVDTQLAANPISERKVHPELREALDVIAAAKAAKERLEALGWQATGKAHGSTVTVTAVRGDETIIMEWQDGAFVGQQYFAWDVDQPFRNARPWHEDLGFNPDEIPDRELVRYLSGMKVTWWNRLADNKETAVIGDKLTIQHNYTGIGNEVPADRIITFVDRDGGGFRSFRLGALMRLG